MKRATDYTQEELLGLDEAGINTLIEIEMMIEGITEVAAPPPEPIFGALLKTYPFYTFNGVPFFDTMEAAMQAAALSTHVSTYESHKGVYSVERDMIQVKLEERYLAEDLRSSKAERESFDKKLNAWEKEARSYRDYCKQRDKVESTVYGVIYDAKEALGKERARDAQYAKYLSLAGDPTIAARFFLDSLLKDGWSQTDANTELLRVQG